ncbi:hypothetical protein FA13DRAFT_1823582 [Coprinellus micaceus]|uniref:Uncharacterized protein n=1 Tax=Coprinellus micaceus TaxID=71717 RepID=A0A4Y7RVP1_COPMI|nr:hypothetical protein FA13DRAFT_1823582 [Coprinellus micaceus]
MNVLVPSFVDTLAYRRLNYDCSSYSPSTPQRLHLVDGLLVTNHVSVRLLESAVHCRQQTLTFGTIDSPVYLYLGWRKAYLRLIVSEHAVNVTIFTGATSLHTYSAEMLFSLAAIFLVALFLICDSGYARHATHPFLSNRGGQYDKRDLGTVYTPVNGRDLIDVYLDLGRREMLSELSSRAIVEELVERLERRQNRGTVRHCTINTGGGERQRGPMDDCVR